MKKLEEKDVPEVWRKLAEASSRRLLKTEAKNVVALRSEARRVHVELLGHLASTGTRAGAMAALRRAREAMKAAVADQIVKARSRARDAALEQAKAELNRLAVELRTAGYREGVQFGELSKDPTDDEAHADAVASSFAARWAQNVLAMIAVAGDDEDPKVAFKARLVMQRLDKRIGVIASTETAKAYNDQRQDALEDELGDDEPNGKKRKWLPLIFKRWSAILDRRTCADCRDLDGELAILGGEFSGHTDDPPLHANCRCDAHLVMLPVPLSEQDDPDPEDLDEEDE